MKNAKKTENQIIPLAATSKFPEEYRDLITQIIEAKVREVMADPTGADFQPFFQPKEIAWEIRRRQTVTERQVHMNAYEDWGCLICETKERPHYGMQMCQRCHGRAWARRRASQQRRENKQDQSGARTFVDTAEFAKAAMVPSIELLTGVGLYPDPPQLPKVVRTFGAPQRHRTLSEAALEVCVNKLTLKWWLRNKILEGGSIVASHPRRPGVECRLWSEEDIERLRAFVESRRVK